MTGREQEDSQGNESRGERNGAYRIKHELGFSHVSLAKPRAGTGFYALAGRCHSLRLRRRVPCRCPASQPRRTAFQMIGS